MTGLELPVRGITAAAWPGPCPVPACHDMARPGSGLAHLLSCRPPIVIAGGASGGVVAALAYRLLHARTRLLLRCDNLPRAWQVVDRLALAIADGVLAGDEHIRAAVARMRRSDRAVFHVPAPHDITPMLGGGVGRGMDGAHRIVVCGGQSTLGDGLQISHGIATWAERNPACRLELTWLGHGDLRDVLAAQAVPATVGQRFVECSGITELAACFSRCGTLIVAAPPSPAMMVAAMASGLIVLYDSGCQLAAPLLRDDETGFAFDAAAPDGLAGALDRLMAAPGARLDAMRREARRHVLPMAMETVMERREDAIACVLRTARVAPLSLQRD